MATTTDYDAPRTATAADDSLEELHARRRAPATMNDTDDGDLAASPELPDADLSDEELTVAVMPMRTDEFRCARCFLVGHRSQRATDAQDVCLDCT